jgi:hypothetical protein
MEVRVIVSDLKEVLNEADEDNPYAQPVSGVLNKIGIARKFTFLEVSNLN